MSEFSILGLPHLVFRTSMFDWLGKQPWKGRRGLWRWIVEVDCGSSSVLAYYNYHTFRGWQTFWLLARQYEQYNVGKATTMSTTFGTINGHLVNNAPQINLRVARRCDWHGGQK